MIICVTGIANALDLTDRILPRLQARPNCKPKLLNFTPYTRNQIVKVLQDRLEKVSALMGYSSGWGFCVTHFIFLLLKYVKIWGEFLLFSPEVDMLSLN